MACFGKKTRVPDLVLEAAKKAGGSVAKIPGEDLYCVRCEFGDACYNVLNKWVSTLDADPHVTVNFAPPPRVQGTAIRPRLELVGSILVEASSIVHHYAPLRSVDFVADALPALPAPLDDAVEHVPLHHPQISLNALHARIQNVNDPNYPVLSHLPSLSYVCNVSVEWANASVVTYIVKP
jgi:predicted membrane-bound mannosyltransferase